MRRENPDDVQGSLPNPAVVPQGKRLRFNVEAHAGGAVVLHCQGRIVVGPEARSLTALLSDLLPTARRLVVDLAGIDRIDSAGLGELVLLHMWAEAAGYRLKFACPRKPVRQLLELTNLISVIDTYPTVAQAVTAIWDEEACIA